MILKGFRVLFSPERECSRINDSAACYLPQTLTQTRKKLVEVPHKKFPEQFSLYQNSTLVVAGNNWRNIIGNMKGGKGGKGKKLFIVIKFTYFPKFHNNFLHDNLLFLSAPLDLHFNIKHITLNFCLKCIKMREKIVIVVVWSLWPHIHPRRGKKYTCREKYEPFCLFWCIIFFFFSRCVFRLFVFCSFSFALYYKHFVHRQKKSEGETRTL
jgi:hypothetical protein